MKALETTGLVELGRATTPEALAPDKPTTLERVFIVELGARAAGSKAPLIDEEARTVIFPFASETREVEQWFGTEILDHGPGAVMLERLIAAGPVLMDHMRDVMVGRVREAWVGEDRRTWAKVQFSRSVKASEVLQDVVDDIRVMVSCRYRVHEMVLVERAEGKPDVYRVTKWEPFEVSFVSIPADISVGVGRELVVQGSTPVAQPTGNAGRQEDMKMTSTRAAQPKLDPHAEGGGGGGTQTFPGTPPAPVVSVDETARAAREGERARMNGISDVARKVSHLFDAGDLARQFQESGRSVAEFHAAVMDKLGTVQQPVITARGAGEGSAAIGMSEADIRNYSLVRACNAMLSGDWTKAGLERAASDAVTQALGREPRGIWFPHDVMAHNPFERRELTSSTGGALIDTKLMVGSFIDLMRNNSVVAKAGATIIPGLVGDLDIPKMVSGIGGGWIDETTPVSGESSPVIGAVAMSPKVYRIRTDISRKMLKQPSLGIEMLIRREIARQAGAGIDEAAVNGSGVGTIPQGLITMPLVPVVAIGANGGALAWSHIVDLETALGNHKQLGGLGYITNSSTVGSMKKTPRHATATVGGYLVDSDGKLNGYPLLETNFVPANLVKGSSGAVCSALLYGSWPALMLGLWGGLDIELDKSSLAVADRGGVTLRGFQDIDLKVQYAGAFAVCKDVLNQ